MIETNTIQKQTENIKAVDARLDRLGQRIDAAEQRAKEALHPHSLLIDVPPVEPEELKK